MPLLSKVGWRDDEDPPLAFGPALRDDHARFDSLPQPDFVGQDGAFRQRRLEREQRRIHLVGIQVHLRINQCAGELLQAVRRTAFGQLVGEVFRVIIG